MKLKLYDVSWTGGRYNERDATVLEVVGFAAEKGYEIVHSPRAGEYNLYRGGELVAVAVEARPAAPAEKVDPLARFRKHLSKASALCFLGS